MPTAFITGPAGGLGTAIADALAPTHTLFLGGRPSDRLDALAQRLGATTWPLDLQDPDEILSAVEPIDELDVLIHNAGAAFPGRVAESTVDEWRVTMEVNVIGAVALTLALLPALHSARGHVVFINSGAGINASPGLASYTASKFALRGFADSLRNDEPALRVTSIHPGRIATVMQEGLVAYEGGEYKAERFLSPETVASIVADAVNAPPDAHIHEVVVRPNG
jgi:NADP-dependent 3-hydroxy acid dehydrogenase YdfG